MLDFFIQLLRILIFPGFLFIILLGFVYEWIDRKFYAKLQNRVGPLYTGTFGFLQPFADFIKLLSKEDITPMAADRALFSATPIIALSLMLTAALLIPVYELRGIVSFRGDLILAIVLMTFFCIVVFLSGMYSTNRFSAIGAERAVLQLIGYEIPIALAVVGVALSAKSLTIMEIVQKQAEGFWFILGPQALGFAIFLIAAQAELERIPFDIPEAEQEIVAGWLTEFSGRKLALFRLANDVELVYVSGLVATLYLGGPLGPFIPGFESILSFAYFLVKTIAVLLILTTIRALFARLKIYQMVNFSWKYLIPLSLFQLILVRVIV
ncbi:MAG: complex I subunit 1 family protein [Candidatus Bathyarchaeia archaeon]